MPYKGGKGLCNKRIGNLPKFLSKLFVINQFKKKKIKSNQIATPFFRTQMRSSFFKIYHIRGSTAHSDPLYLRLFDADILNSFCLPPNSSKSIHRNTRTTCTSR